MIKRECVSATSTLAGSALRFSVGLLVVSVLLLAAGPLPARAQQGQTFTVNAIGDAPDADPGDTTCATSQGRCTLRAAIQETNELFNELGTQEIVFDIPGTPPHVIQPQTALPTITDPIIIDGTTEPDYEAAPVVVIDGREAGAEASGVSVIAGGSTISGLSIVAFAEDGIQLETGGGNAIEGNYVGLRPDGETVTGNGGAGLALIGSPDNQVGGVSPGAGNLVAGNQTEILVASNGNTIQGNFLGTNRSGVDLGTSSGLRVVGDSSLIGGTAPGAGNVIAHTQTSAVRIGGARNVFRGNYVGTNRESLNLGAAGTGVRLLGPNNTIGGAEPGTANVIAHNAFGVTSEEGSGNVIRLNRIYDNDGLGIDLGARDGRTSNDGGDADNGPNRLQNFPELQQSTYRPLDQTLTVDYQVPSDPSADALGAADYPLLIDFYIADADEEEGKKYLGTDIYSSEEPNDYSGCGAPPCAVTTTFVQESDLTRGNQLVATATDADGNTSEFSTSLLVKFPSTLEAGVQLAAEQYRMVSIPVRLQDASLRAVFADDFGALDSQDWRVLRWQTNPERSECGAGRYRELTGDVDPAEASLERGHAYWLISRTGGRFDVDEARSVGGEPVTLTLPPGWSQIANPHPFPVAWSSVAGRTDLQNGSPYAYEAGTEDRSSYIPNAVTLDPWTGYWVCNPDGSSLEITIPPRKAEARTIQASRSQSKALDLERFFGHRLAFGLQLHASMRMGENVEADRRNAVGIAFGATAGRAQEDVLEPPAIQESLRLSILEDSSRLAGSLRPEGKPGYIWKLAVSAPLQRRAGQHKVRLRLRSQGATPPHFGRRLIDRNTGQPVPRDRGGYTLSVSKDRPTRHLQLLVGNREFLRTEVENVRPTRNGLRAIHPNPASAGRPVTVDYRLKTAQHVKISVYDILGRRVTVLVDERRSAGHHTARWNGRGAVASGVYFVRMRTASTTNTERISLLR